MKAIVQPNLGIAHILYLATGFRRGELLTDQGPLEDLMRYRKYFIFALLALFPAHIAAQTKEPLKLVATIPLPGLKDGDFEHFAPDIDGHRLFLTDEENDKVDVLDTAT